MVRVFGVQGIGKSPRRWHDNAYALGFNLFQYITWYILMPLSIPASFVFGAFISAFQVLSEMIALKAAGRLIGDTLGRWSVEFSGKREYYEKKTAYYEMCIRERRQELPV